MDLLNTLLSYIPGHVYWQGLDGTILGCNDEQARSLGYDFRDDVIGKKPSELLKKEEAEALMDVFHNTLKLGVPVTIEESTTYNQKMKEFLSYKIPLKNEDGYVTGVLGLSIDISKQKEAERQLLKEKKKVEQSDQLKTAFIQNMEHDIRTPISGVFGLIDILSVEENDPKKQEIISMLSNASKELLDYCNELLDFTKIEIGAQPVTEKPINLYRLIEGVFSLERPAAKQKNIELTYVISDALPKLILSDEFRLKRILLNLIGNALKFTQIGEIKIHLNKIIPARDQRFVLEISIEDTGIGIPDDKQNLIYQKYVKVSPSNKGLYKGTGLGLSMVKQFVGELNGEIQLESELGKGSIFTVLIPVKQSLSLGLSDD